MKALAASDPEDDSRSEVPPGAFSDLSQHPLQTHKGDYLHSFLLLFDHGLASPFVPPLVYCYASYQPSPLAYCYVPPLNDSIINDSAQWRLFQRTPQA
ncbi:hypothetical protein F2Q69_00031299 [Brassica cretica]|uniref:Uncharacterized protein n=1 Tax=Brassica cretica TaxID=69181 RepID=A0A8S9RW89_BRACR|nr:hypothetical protein F2Q69_00031299 [Brassica cretica]